MKILKKIALPVFFFLLILTSLIDNLTLSSVKAQDKKAPETDTVAAVLNGREIKISEIDEELKHKPSFAMYNTMDQKSPEMIRQLRTSVLNGIIDRALLLEAAEKSGVVSEDEVSRSATDVLARYGGESNLEAALKPSGLPPEKFMRELKNDFRISQYLEKAVMKNVSVDPAEARKVFESNPKKYDRKEEVRASHILIRTPAKATEEQDAEAKKRIESIYRDVTKPGADFAKTAADKSECPSSGQGGDLGFFGRGAMVKDFETVAFSLKPGEISKPIKTQFGYHIIKVAEKHEAGAAEFEKARSQIEKEIVNRKKGDLVNARIKELRDAAVIKITL